MKRTTLIEWTMMTGGPWLICTEVSPGCTNCYARELILNRLAPLIRKAYKAAGFEDWETRPLWGKKAVRVVTKGFWDDVRSAHRKAVKDQRRVYWFPSLIDWLDDMPAGIIDQDGNWQNRVEIFVNFLKVVNETPWITWQLLTKRPQDFHKRMAEAFDFFQSGDGPVKRMITDWLEGRPPANVWIGATTENQKEADTRIPAVLKIPAAYWFLSVEPMLEVIDLHLDVHNAKAKQHGPASGPYVGLCIFGGESGAGARGCNMGGIRDGVRQCQHHGVLAFVKQMGSNTAEVFPDPTPAPTDQEIQNFQANGFCRTDMTNVGGVVTWVKRYRWRHPKGGDPEEWPEDLRVRQFPE